MKNSRPRCFEIPSWAIALMKYRAARLTGSGEVQEPKARVEAANAHSPIDARHSPIAYEIQEKATVVGIPYFSLEEKP